MKLVYNFQLDELLPEGWTAIPTHRWKRIESILEQDVWDEEDRAVLYGEMYDVYIDINCDRGQEIIEHAEQLTLQFEPPRPSDINGPDLNVPEGMQRYLPVRIVAKYDEEGNIQGLTEESWHMDWSSSRANIFWSGKAYSILGEHQLDGIKDAEHNCNRRKGQFLINPFCADSPVVFDWDRWLNATDKYNKRNACFVMKAT